MFQYINKKYKKFLQKKKEEELLLKQEKESLLIKQNYCKHKNMYLEKITNTSGGVVTTTVSKICSDCKYEILIERDINY